MKEKIWSRIHNTKGNVCPPTDNLQLSQSMNSEMSCSQFNSTTEYPSCSTQSSKLFLPYFNCYLVLLLIIVSGTFSLGDNPMKEKVWTRTHNNTVNTSPNPTDNLLLSNKRKSCQPLGSLCYQKQYFV